MIPLSKVPQNKRLLWYFDPDMCHDLLWVYNVGYVLVERAVISNYPWAEDFSENLFQDLLPYSYAQTFLDPRTDEEYPRFSIPCESTVVDTTVTLPKELSKKLVITWLYLVGNITHDCPYNTKPFLIKRHHRVYPCKGQQIHLNFTCCKYSVVMSGMDIEIDLGDADYKSYKSFSWDENIDNVYGSEYYNISPPTHGALVDFSAVGRGNTTITRAVARGSTGETTYFPKSVGKVPHGALIFAKPQYSKISSQGISTNIILGNPPLRVLDESILEKAIIPVGRKAQSKLELVPITEIAGGLLSDTVYPYGRLPNDQKLGLLSRLEVWIPTNPTIVNGRLRTQPKKVTDNLFFWEIGGEYTYDHYEAGIGVLPGRWHPAGFWQIPDDDTVRALAAGRGDWFFVHLGNGMYLVRINIPAAANDMVHTSKRTISYGSPLKGKMHNVSYDIYRFVTIGNTAPATLNYDSKDDPWEWETLLEAREHYHKRLYTLKSIITFTSYIDTRHPNSGEVTTFYNLYVRPLVNKSLANVVNSLGENPFKHLQGFDPVSTGGSGGDSELVAVPITLNSKLTLTLKYIMELSDSLRIQEIHAILGAEEYALDENGDPIYMSIARNVDLLAKALGINYNPDGTKLEIDLNEPPQADD